MLGSTPGFRLGLSELHTTFPLLSAAIRSNFPSPVTANLGDHQGGIEGLRLGFTMWIMGRVPPDPNSDPTRHANPNPNPNRHANPIITPDLIIFLTNYIPDLSPAPSPVISSTT